MNYYLLLVHYWQPSIMVINLLEVSGGLQGREVQPQHRSRGGGLPPATAATSCVPEPCKVQGQTLTGVSSPTSPPSGSPPL